MDQAAWKGLDGTTGVEVVQSTNAASLPHNWPARVVQKFGCWNRKWGAPTVPFPALPGRPLRLPAGSLKGRPGRAGKGTVGAPHLRFQHPNFCTTLAGQLCGSEAAFVD
eukprot:TRINITY_DN65192_c0_g2_i5.p2 TRINITY_DN65192_c0_g2~~TRINITY_DN65192_c0_g2_i5.p2  ORF type:complete len:109 (+),score=3.65 TRINITY_DN65192_c0_g2_i5:1639-1965(+)